MSFTNRILSRSLFVFHMGGSACNNCDIEILDALTPKYDLERFGIVKVPSIRQADLILVSGVFNRKVAERAIQTKEATLTAIFQRAPVAILLLDRDRRVQRMNRAAEAVLGQTNGNGDVAAFGLAIRCIRAESGECGCSASCVACPIRRAVTTTFDTGQPQNDIEVTMALRSSSLLQVRYLQY